MRVEGKAEMSKVLKYIHEKQDFIKDSEDAEALRKKGIDIVIGSAKFASKNTIAVNGKTFKARKIFLCTGSKPKMLDIDHDKKIPIYTNETIFFDCKILPDHLVVVGGGPIGCELGQAFARLGSKVTLVNRDARILDKEPEQVSKILEDQFKKEGITVLNNHSLEGVDNGNAVVTSKENGQSILLKNDAILMAIGRKVFTEGLQLDKAGIKTDEKGKIKVNEFLQSTNKNVYVIGDAAGTYQFSHGAEKMVRQVWRNLIIPLFKKKNTLNDLSWVTFTYPQVAHFGLTESQMNDQNIKYYRQDQDFKHEDRAIIQEYQYGNLSVWYDDNSNIGKKKILSATMIAPEAGELIQELQLAKHAGIPVKTINNRVYPYPVATRVNQKNTGGLMEKTFTQWKLDLAKKAFRFFH